jgi:hypothetical protein
MIMKANACRALLAAVLLTGCALPASADDRHRDRVSVLIGFDDFFFGVDSRHYGDRYWPRYRHYDPHWRYGYGAHRYYRSPWYYRDPWRGYYRHDRRWDRDHWRRDDHRWRRDDHRWRDDNRRWRDDDRRGHRDRGRNDGRRDDGRHNRRVN